jgi:hypothetical protein
MSGVEGEDMEWLLWWMSVVDEADSHPTQKALAAG